MIDQFFSLYTTKTTNEAIDYIFATNKWMDESKDQIEGVKLKLSSTLKLIGEYTGHNLIKKKTVGEYLTLYTFMVRYDRQPMRFNMLFYKPQDTWRLQHFSFDDNIEDELQEPATAFRFKENFNN